MSGGGVEIKVILFDVLSVIPFVAGQAEQPLLQNRIAAVPQAQREANQLVAIGDAADPVFAPAVGPGARVVVRKILPGCPVRAVILTHRSPLPLAQIGPPALPVGLVQARFFKPDFFLGHDKIAEARSVVANLSSSTNKLETAMAR